MEPSALVEKPPVLLVPGAFGQEYLYWNLIKFQLGRRGYPVHTVSFPTLTLSDLRVSAHLLAERVRELREATGTPKVILVAHSMGGLISRYFIQFLRGAGHVQHLVCLGTPHRGTYAGIAGYPLMGARQILPGSTFLQGLNDPAYEDHGVPITNVWCRTDLIVVPRRNALLEAPGVTNVCLTWEGHWGFLVSPGVVRRIVHAIETRSPQEAAMASRADQRPGAADAPA